MPIIQGSVIDVFHGHGRIRPIRPDRAEVAGNVRFNPDKVIDRHPLSQGDRVEPEARPTESGWEAVWVKYEGPPLPVVEGEGRITAISKAGTRAMIEPDTEGADFVRFYSQTSLHGEWYTGDGVRFVARQGTNGFWKAISIEKITSVRKMPKPISERSWRDSWSEPIVRLTDN